MSLKNLFFAIEDFLLKHRWQKSRTGSAINGEVLMYHNVTDDWTSDGLTCRCPVKVFEHYLDVYSNNGFEFLSIDEMYKRITKKDGNERKFCLLTFDDIPDNVYQNAYPILKKRGIPFVVFISTKYVDWVNPETGEQYITTDHLKELDKDPLCTVAAHTTTHPMLRNVNNSLEEIKGNKEWLETLLDHSIDYLAYPYGKHSSVSKRIQKEARKCGFKCAFGTIDSPLTDKNVKCLYYLPRIVRN